MSWFTSKQLPFRLPFTLDTGLMAAAFMILGYILGEKIQWLLTQSRTALDILLCLAAAGLLCVAAYWAGAYCLMYENAYGNYPFTILAAVCGSVLFFLLAKRVYRFASHCARVCDPVIWYGVHSLAVFPVHLLIKMFPMQFDVYYGHWAVLFLAMLIGTIPIVNLITVYFPFMLGNISFRKH